MDSKWRSTTWVAKGEATKARWNSQRSTYIEWADCGNCIKSACDTRESLHSTHQSYSLGLVGNDPSVGQAADKPVPSPGASAVALERGQVWQRRKDVPELSGHHCAILGK